LSAGADLPFRIPPGHYTDNLGYRQALGIADDQTLLTSRRGVAATLLRAGMYRLLRLPEPQARPVHAAHAMQ